MQIEDEVLALINESENPVFTFTPLVNDVISNAREFIKKKVQKLEQDIDTVDSVDFYELIYPIVNIANRISTYTRIISGYVKEANVAYAEHPNEFEKIDEIYSRFININIDELNQYYASLESNQVAESKNEATENGQLQAKDIFAFLQTPGTDAEQIILIPDSKGGYKAARNIQVVQVTDKQRSIQID